MKKNIQHAFTLVELLVVILIITILMAMILPTLERAQDMAYMASCGNNLKQVMVVTHEYGLDWRVNLPQVNTFGDNPDGTPYNMMGYHSLYEGGYLDTADILREKTYEINGLANRTRHGGSNSLLMCPAARFRGYNGIPTAAGSYAFGSPISTGGLDEVVYIGNKTRWRDLWMITNSLFRWYPRRTDFTRQILGEDNALAISSYAIQRSTRHGYQFIDNIFRYKPLRDVKHPARKIWWAECVEPTRAAAETFAFTGRRITAGTITGNYLPEIRLPHPYGNGGLFAMFDGHVEAYFREDMQRAGLENGNSTTRTNLDQSAWEWEFYAADENIEGIDVRVPWPCTAIWGNY